MHCMHMHVCTTCTTDRPSKQQLTQPGRTPPEELERARTTKPPAIHERFFPCGWNRFLCAELPPVWNVNPNLAVVNTTPPPAAAAHHRRRRRHHHHRRRLLDVHAHPAVAGDDPPSAVAARIRLGADDLPPRRQTIRLSACGDGSASHAGR